MVGWQLQVVSWCQPWIDPWCSPEFNTIQGYPPVQEYIAGQEVLGFYQSRVGSSENWYWWRMWTHQSFNLFVPHPSGVGKVPYLVLFNPLMPLTHPVPIEFSTMAGKCHDWCWRICLIQAGWRVWASAMKDYHQEWLNLWYFDIANIPLLPKNNGAFRNVLCVCSLCFSKKIKWVQNSMVNCREIAAICRELPRSVKWSKYLCSTKNKYYIL